MNNIILTVCILSFNRSDSLDKQLMWLQEEADERLQVFVIDNASTDDSLETLNKYKARIKNYSYVVNDANVGCDGSIVKSANYCDGDYVLFLGDDYYSRGSIKTIIDILESYEPNILHITNKASPERVIFKNFNEKEIAKMISRQLSFYMFMSANIYRKSVVEECNRLLKLEYATTLFYSLSSLRIGKTLILNEQLIQQDFGNISWSNNTSKVWFFNIPLVFERCESNGYKKRFIKKMKHRNYGYFLFCSTRKMFKALKYIKKNKRFLEIVNPITLFYYNVFLFKKIFGVKNIV